MKKQPPTFEGVDLEWIPTARPTGRQLWILIAAFWAGEFLLATLRSAVDGSTRLHIYTLLRIVTALLAVGECYLLHRLAQSMRGRSFPRLIAVLLLASALAGAINLYAGDFLQDLTDVKVKDFGFGWRVYKLTYWMLLFSSWASIYLALLYGGEARDQERHARVLEHFAHNAQLRALRFQVDPHFLFNTLNSVAALVRADRKTEAELMVCRMSDFFRSTLAANPHDDISLAEELALQELYLAIERVRFPNMTVEIELAADVRVARVPALLLQPLVENAVKYSVAARTGPTRIKIAAFLSEDGFLELSVTDDGAGVPSAPGTGTGLLNVSERLRARFGDFGKLSAGPVEPAGWRSHVRMPLTN